MKTHKLFFTALLLTGLAYAGCSKNDDNDSTKPVITLNSPEEGEIIYAGTDTSIICLNATFSDNEKLKQYKINIHNAAGHGHKNGNNLWDTTIVQPLDGRSRDVDFDINLANFNIADTADYHFMVYCLDEAGNESMVYRTIEVKWHSKK